MPAPLELVKRGDYDLIHVPEKSIDQVDVWMGALVRRTGTGETPWKLIVVFCSGMGDPNVSVKRFAVSRDAPEWQKRIASELGATPGISVTELIKGLSPDIGDEISSIAAKYWERQEKTKAP